MIVLKDEKILDIGIPNKNNRIYPKDSILEFLRYEMVVGFMGMNTTNINDSSHYVSNLRYENGTIIGDITIFDETTRGKILKDFIDINNEYAIKYGFRPDGIGEIEVLEDGTTIVKNYKLNYINYTTDPA